MPTYSVTDIDGFVDTIRHGAASSITENFADDLNEFMTLGQVKKLVISKSLGLDEYGYHTITEDIFDELFEEIRSTIYQSGLAKLAANGMIECAWDDQSNEMVFWIKDSEQHTQIN